MCLRVSSTAKIQIAQSDIECYKIVYYKFGNYSTPYFGEPINDMAILGRAPFCPKTSFPTEPDYECKIYGGAIHAYAYVDDARNALDWAKIIGKLKNYQVFRCKIPTGTRFWQGFADDGKLAIAAEKIVFEKRVAKTKKS